MRVWTLVLLLLAAPAASAESDYAREARWADEITPMILVGEPVYLAQANGHEFLAIHTEVPDARAGVVVVHGIGIHPDWGLIGALRQRLADRGYATLSIQMPILAAEARGDAYAPLLPEAIERLRLAVAWLKARGHARIAIVSHSMGSRMTQAYMKGNPEDVRAWASLGLGSELGEPDVPITYDGIRAAVLDLYGERDLPPVLAGAAARRASLAGNPHSRQVVIANTDHFFVDHEDEMVGAVRSFLDGMP